MCVCECVGCVCAFLMFVWGAESLRVLHMCADTLVMFPVLWVCVCVCVSHRGNVEMEMYCMCIRMPSRPFSVDLSPFSSSTSSSCCSSSSPTCLHHHLKQEPTQIQQANTHTHTRRVFPLPDSASSKFHPPWWRLWNEYVLCFSDRKHTHTSVAFLV